MASKSGRSYSAKGPSQRQLRVGETLRHALSEILIREDFFALILLMFRSLSQKFQ